ncbi:vitelline membrane protein 15a-2-like [Toxorhynchites rutilus septentrionalis]|uniref:vitelline membrane protein 15a-2-like n=1 Tax=Toxorhynchites rutilus septentrionalis TaxID=329112 RepID=UPI002479FC8F|nr:vitelline membrane protein 15a-2-like [Toxorhynchites rutilus septentrionalis]
MNKLLAVTLLSFVVGALANYPPPPKYEAPQKYGGGGGGYGAPQVHTYEAKAPTVKCGSSLLVGCAPSISKVPCIPEKGGYGGEKGGYGGGKGGYGGGGKGGYRSHMDHEESMDQFEE